MQIDNGKRITYTRDENTSAICIMNYDELDFNSIQEKYTAIVIDNDDCSEYLYKNINLLKQYSDKLIINTYDLPQSLYYNLDEEKIRLKSKYSKEYVANNLGKDTNPINEDRIILGKFNEQ